MRKGGRPSGWRHLPSDGRATAPRAVPPRPGGDRPHARLRLDHHRPPVAARPVDASITAPAPVINGEQGPPFLRAAAQAAARRYPTGPEQPARPGPRHQSRSHRTRHGRVPGQLARDSEPGRMTGRLPEVPLQPAGTPDRRFGTVLMVARRARDRAGGLGGAGRRGTSAPWAGLRPTPTRAIRESPKLVDVSLAASTSVPRPAPR